MWSAKKIELTKTMNPTKSAFLDGCMTLKINNEIITNLIESDLTMRKVDSFPSEVWIDNDGEIHISGGMLMLRMEFEKLLILPVFDEIDNLEKCVSLNGIPESEYPPKYWCIHGILSVEDIQLEQLLNLLSGLKLTDIAPLSKEEKCAIEQWENLVTKSLN